MACSCFCSSFRSILHFECLMLTVLIKSCRLELEMAPPDPAKVNVIIDGTTLAQSGADGWDFDNTTTPPGIVVKGATCKALEQMGAEKVTVQFGCPTMVVR